jgi:hypothetical protein
MREEVSASGRSAIEIKPSELSVAPVQVSDNLVKILSWFHEAKPFLKSLMKG